MKRNYICPDTSILYCRFEQTLCASGEHKETLTTGGSANPGGGR